MSSLHINSRLILKNILSLTLSSNMTINNSYIDISTFTIKKLIGKRLTIDSGKIKIGSGVKTIKISGIIGLNSASSTTYYMWTRKNSTNTGAWEVEANKTGYYTMPIEQIIEVTEGDIITLSLYSNTIATLETGKTNINVEVVE